MVRFAPVEAQTTIYYVMPSATGTGNGSSWSNATTLPLALAAATAGTQIWVASGVYTSGTTVNSRFVIPPGVAVYGGFAGDETSLSQRDWVTNVKILSGDVDVITAGQTTATDGSINNSGGGMLCDGGWGKLACELPIGATGFYLTKVDGIVLTRGTHEIKVDYFDVSGEAAVSVGIRKGQIWSGCVNFYFFKICINIPPFDMTKSAYVAAGKFTNGNWGFRAETSFVGVPIGVFVDTGGNVAFGNVSRHRRLTPLTLALARLAQLAQARGAVNAASAWSMEGITLAADETVIDAEFEVDSDIIATFSVNGVPPAHRLTAPDGTVLAPEAPPAYATYSETVTLLGSVPQGALSEVWARSQDRLQQQARGAVMTASATGSALLDEMIATFGEDGATVLFSGMENGVVTLHFRSSELAIALGGVSSAATTETPPSVQLLLPAPATRPVLLQQPAASAGQLANAAAAPQSGKLGEIDVKVTPPNLSNIQGDTIDFTVDLNATGADLSFDLAPLATLRIGDHEMPAEAWEVSLDHGHHVAGVLKFPAHMQGAVEGASVVFIDPAGEELNLTWTTAD